MRPRCLLAAQTSPGDTQTGRRVWEETGGTLTTVPQTEPPEKGVNLKDQPVLGKAGGVVPATFFMSNEMTDV